ncbi:MAG: helical backbone metal receptor [Saprospiraceae bacterium]
MLVRDQLYRTIDLQIPCKKIISVVPSQTELLHDLGLNSEVIGITKFCVHPDSWFQSKTRIGGTKKLNLNKIVELEPDLILANKEENTKEDIDFLAERFPVWISAVYNLESAIQMIVQVGLITGKESESIEITKKIEAAKSLLKPYLPKQQVKICYLIWKEPYMTVGSDTFIHSMLEEAGFLNVFEEMKRYPIVTITEILERKPDFIFLSSEPYPFKESESVFFEPVKVILVDGESFSWYGSHLIQSFHYLRTLISLKI